MRMNTIPDLSIVAVTPAAGRLFDLGEPAAITSLTVASGVERPSAAPRLRIAQREQGEMRVASLDELLTPDHTARTVWDYVSGLDMSPLLQLIHAVQGQVGRDATDPRILLALWLLATIDGIGSARALDRLCREHMAYQWLCGNVSMNYHTLADFRVRHKDFLSDLLTESVASLLHQQLIDLHYVAQDGMRIRASAGASSFRREATLQECLQEAKAQVEALQNDTDEEGQSASKRQQAARERAARERQERIEKALNELAKLHEQRQQQRKEKGTKYEPEKLRTSTTDPEARTIKMPDGGTRPGYNVQFATTVTGGVIVGVDVTNSGSDAGQMQPMIEQVQERCGQAPEAMLVDGGFTTLHDIEAAHQQGIDVYGPIKNEEAKKAKGVDPYEPLPKDDPGVAAWRTRMGTPEAKVIYPLRAQTAELSNAQARNRGLYQVRVRGREKVLAVTLLYALVHNLLRAKALRQAQ
jgi:transposase